MAKTLDENKTLIFRGIDDLAYDIGFVLNPNKHQRETSESNISLTDLNVSVLGCVFSWFVPLVLLSLLSIVSPFMVGVAEFLVFHLSSLVMSVKITETQDTAYLNGRWRVQLKFY